VLERKKFTKKRTGEGLQGKKEKNKGIRNNSPILGFNFVELMKEWGERGLRASDRNEGWPSKLKEPKQGT